MKVNPIRNIKNYVKIALTAGAITLSMPALKAQTTDTFSKISELVTPAGTSDSIVLKNAPSAQVDFMGEKHNVGIVVDLSKNILYNYDENGNALGAYLVASGKKNTPTSPGLRIVTHVETYPYKYAPASSKRRNMPRSYGPKIICLDKLDSATGERIISGQFIHGNNNVNSLGKYASLGCIRMDNEVIKHIAKQVKRGTLVLFK